ncbi:family S53 protease [Mycena sanguinolenta]|nr:family S53 protease [Mycena sanguinolenta]
MAVHESVATLPSGFAHAGPVAPDQVLTLRIALAQSDIAGLEAKTYAVSDPANVLYGQHLTVLSFVKPTPSTISDVSAWLSENGITATSASPAGDLLEIKLAVGKANTLLGTQFGAFTHTANGKTIIRTLSYSIPASLQSHIRFIHPTIAFVPPLSLPSVNAVKVKRDTVVEERVEPTSVAVPASCANVVNPACIEAIYNFPTDIANSSAQNTLGVAGYIDQYANFADLAPWAVVCSPDTRNAGIEADLDVEMAVSLAGGVPTAFISVGDDNTDDFDGFTDIGNFILTSPVETRPTVLTTSYGFNEPYLPISLAVGICNAYMQLGAVGISVLFASGDGGVGGVQPTLCTTFVPTAPGGCPFVTSVGGSTGVPPQVAASLSGGGFSNYFPTPNYQAADIAAYIASIGTEYAGLYNASGRGFPDVAMQALNVEIAWMNGFWLVGGTSCASPMFAAMIALVNDRLIAAGRPVLGFLNPFLYSPAGRPAFNDVTSGNNPGCGTEGFTAGPGWDPVTGLGTPDFNLLLAAVGL